MILFEEPGEGWDLFVYHWQLIRLNFRLGILLFLNFCTSSKQYDHKLTGNQHIFDLIIIQMAGKQISQLLHNIYFHRKWYINVTIVSTFTRFLIQQNAEKYPCISSIQICLQLQQSFCYITIYNWESFLYLHVYLYC